MIQQPSGIPGGAAEGAAEGVTGPQAMLIACSSPSPAPIMRTRNPMYTCNDCSNNEWAVSRARVHHGSNGAGHERYHTSDTSVAKLMCLDDLCLGECDLVGAGFSLS